MADNKTITKIKKLLSQLEAGQIDNANALSQIANIINDFAPNNLKVEAEYFTQAILNRVADPIFIKDEEHKWVLLNDAFCVFLGHSREELIGKSDYEFFPKEEADVYWQVDDRVFNEDLEILNEEFQTNPITGIKQVLSTKKNLYIDDTGRKFIVGVIRDISEQKKAEQKLKEITETKEKLFSILAHDIKEPFNSLVGFSDLLIRNYDKYDDEQKLKFLNIIDKANRDNLLFIENMLAWTSGQMGKLKYNPEDFDLVEICEDSLLIFRSAMSYKNIEIITNYYTDKIIVNSDLFMIKTIIRNLLSNAVKFTSAKGKIIINIDDDREYIKLCVKDTGAGMDKEKLEQIKSDQYLSTSGTHGEKGIGLGLRLCHEFSELCNCIFDVNSKKGTGTEFYLKFLKNISIK